MKDAPSRSTFSVAFKRTRRPTESMNSTLARSSKVASLARWASSRCAKPVRGVCVDLAGDTEDGGVLDRSTVTRKAARELNEGSPVTVLTLLKIHARTRREDSPFLLCGRRGGRWAPAPTERGGVAARRLSDYCGGTPIADESAGVHHGPGTRRVHRRDRAPPDPSVAPHAHRHRRPPRQHRRRARGEHLADGFFHLATWFLVVGAMLMIVRTWQPASWRRRGGRTSGCCSPVGACSTSSRA